MFISVNREIVSSLCITLQQKHHWKSHEKPLSGALGGGAGAPWVEATVFHALVLGSIPTCCMSSQQHLSWEYAIYHTYKLLGL